MKEENPGVRRQESPGKEEAAAWPAWELIYDKKAVREELRKRARMRGTRVSRSVLP